MADLYSPAVVGRARNVEDATEGEAHAQSGLQALVLGARLHRDIAKLKGDMAGEADWQRHVDCLSGYLADHETNVYRERVAGEKMLAAPSTARGRSMDEQLHDEATVLAAAQHRAQVAADADETQRLDVIEARIRRIERDDRAMDVALQARAIAEARR